MKFVQAYREAGVPVHAVTLQNEPQNRNPSGYPGADMPAWQQVKLAAVVGAAFDAARLDTLILGYDHNWAEHPNDIATTPPGEDPETDYPYRCCAPRRSSGSTGSPTTATPASRPTRPSCTTRSPAPSSGSPSAPARTARPTRRRRCSPTP